MWSMFYALFLSGMFITAAKNDFVLCILFAIVAHICAVGVVVSHEKQKEKIKTLENKIEKLEELVGEDK